MFLIRIIDKIVSLFIGVAYVGAVLFAASCNPVIGPFAFYVLVYYCIFCYIVYWIACYIVYSYGLFVVKCSVYILCYAFLPLVVCSHLFIATTVLILKTVFAIVLSREFPFWVFKHIVIPFMTALPEIILPLVDVGLRVLVILAIIVIVPLAWLKKFILIYVDIILDAISAWLATYYVDTLMFVWNFTFTVVGVLLATALLTLLERKVMASIQRRRGPNVVGFFGLLQPFADGLKLALKETIVPKLAVKPLFILGPIISFGLAIFGWALLPFPTWFCFYGEDFVSDSGSSIIRLIPGSAFIDFDVGLLFIFVIVALHVYGVLLGGWGSNSRYALLGALRATAQSISYELVMGFVLIILALHHGGFSLLVIVFDQADIWNIFALFPVFIIFYICSLAELNRTPFDLVEAEGELVAGYNVEYSAMLFALYFLGEYISIIFSGFVIAVLFLGAWFIPKIFYFFLEPLVCCLLPTTPYPAVCLFMLSAFFFVIKATLVIISGLLIRFVLPRYRYDQLMALGWTVFLPILLFFLIFYAIIILYLF